jgi:hypothetical protein
MFIEGEELTADAVIPRIGASHTFYGNAVVRQFEMMGVFTVNDSVAIARSRDKLRSMQLLARKGVGLPITGIWMSLVGISGSSFAIKSMLPGPDQILQQRSVSEIEVKNGLQLDLTDLEKSFLIR